MRPFGRPDSPRWDRRPTSRGARGVDDNGRSAPDTSLRRAVEEYLASQGLQHASDLSEVAACWEEVVGPDVAAHSSPRALRDGELAVAVDHSAWATEFAFLGEKICAELSQRLGRPIAKRLKVHVEADRRLD